MRKITLNAGCADTNKLIRTSEVCLPADLQHFILLGDKMNLPRGVSKSKPCQLKHYGFIST
jgi:hypothetical protein